MAKQGAAAAALPRMSQSSYDRKKVSLKKYKWLLIGLFLFVCGAEFAAGYYYNYVLQYSHSDALSRVANAFYVLHSREPHLAAIGFIWNPLPSLIDMLFIWMFYPIFPAIATYGLAGVMMSSLFAGGTAVLLASESLRYKHGVATSLTLSLLYCLNPFMFMFGSNGLSDAPFNFFIIAMVIAFMGWVRDEQPFGLVIASFSMALAFWTRYEAVPAGVAIFISTYIAALFIHRRLVRKPIEQRKWKYQLLRGEGTVILLFTPVIYSGLLWIMWNYIIMGNPFYFLNSEYSNVAQVSSLLTLEDNTNYSGQWIPALLVTLQKTAFYSIPLLVIILLRLFDGRLFKPDILILGLLFAAIPAMQYLMMLKGTSYAWFRYFMSVFPITVAFFSYELKQTKLKTFARFLMFGGLIASAALLTYTLTQPDIAPDENSYVYRTNHVEDMRVEREMARYFDENMPDATIMVDSSTAYTLILASKIPQKFVITSDSLFKESISDPYVYDIEYMLLPRPYTGGPISAINIAYPNLYNQGAPWVEKAMDFGDGRWRMYKVISSQNALPSVENKPQAETPTTEQGTEGNPDEHMLEQEREPSIEQQEQAPEQPFLQSDEQGSEQT